MKHIGSFEEYGKINELSSDVEKAREVYFKKVQAVSAAIRALHEDEGLFELDKGAKEAYEKFLKDASGESWKYFYRYVKGTEAPKLAPPKIPQGKTPPPPVKTPPPPVKTPPPPVKTPPPPVKK